MVAEIDGLSGRIHGAGLDADQRGLAYHAIILASGVTDDAAYHQDVRQVTAEPGVALELISGVAIPCDGGLANAPRGGLDS